MTHSMKFIVDVECESILCLTLRTIQLYVLVMHCTEGGSIHWLMDLQMSYGHIAVTNINYTSISPSSVFHKGAIPY